MLSAVYLFILADSISIVMLLLLLVVGRAERGTDMRHLRLCIKSHSLDWSRKSDPSPSQ